MANNRMWLVHRPTGKKVMLGKRMAGNWYRAKDVNAELDALLVDCFDDEFCLAMEDISNAPDAKDISDCEPTPATSETKPTPKKG